MAMNKQRIFVPSNTIPCLVYLLTGIADAVGPLGGETAAAAGGGGGRAARALRVLRSWFAGLVGMVLMLAVISRF